jgi:hypothetical protein
MKDMPRKQRCRPGFGRSEADHRGWTYAYFTRLELFTLDAAHAAARHPQ